MKILFCGLSGSNGPGNINKGIITYQKKKFLCSRSTNKYINLLTLLIMLPFSDVIIISGVTVSGYVLMRVAKLLTKKIVFLMHGDVAYESVINHSENFDRIVRYEKELMESSDLMLAVSKLFMRRLNKIYPQYKHKTSYVYNGLDFKENERKELLRDRGSLAAAGGAFPMKNNNVVAEVVEEMKTVNEFCVYGEPVTKSVSHCAKTKFTGNLPRERFLEELCKTEIFVVNSIFDTFNQTALEALFCGCSILLSENVGVIDLLQLTENDIIRDPMDKEEIRRKIEYLQTHPNNERIMSSLNVQDFSFDKMVASLENECIKLMRQEN